MTNINGTAQTAGMKYKLLYAISLISFKKECLVLSKIMEK